MQKAIRPSRRWLVLAFSMILTLAVGSTLRAAEEKPATQPTTAPAGATLEATDKVGLEANLGKPVTVSGTITKAEWSKSGKVMNVELEKGELALAVFEKSKEAVNQAFGGDAAKAWTGAKVTVTGKVAKYGGRAKEMEGKFQIVITDPKQMTVVQAK